MDINQYLKQLNTRYQSGISKEHAYRSDLEHLIRELVPGVEITNEPANVTDCGNPDYVITRKKIPMGYIEAKDIGKDLNGSQYKEQFTRYKKALDNLIITDYTRFQFFQHGQLIHEISIGEPDGNTIHPVPENFEQFERLIKDFCLFIGQTIKSSKKLAEMMAAKARLLENILERAVTSDEESQDNTSLKGQFESFKHILIHDLTPKAFADIYAQTLAYGMFAARLHDPTLNDFSRQEAAELIPKTNPFLRKLFHYVAGYDIDQRIRTTVDNLAEVFRATDVNALLHNFGKTTQTQDPVIHFYETFLSEYDPKLRKSRGVWYTPEPVVNFIVRAVDDILKTEFDLPDGIADTSKTKIKVKEFSKATADRRSKTKQIEREKEVHKVQILDPATGTGTFLAEVVKHIYNTQFQSMQGAWSGYVEEHLIPRLNGFELLMASYSMAHLKLDMLLTETGYKSQKDKRFNIYLTNSLEEHHPDTGTLFAQWLSSEANEANHIKRDTPVMVVMGNPPYNRTSNNASDFILNLLGDYKKNLNERNLVPLDDDYIKFIRYGQHYIDKNGEGILAYISNNSFVDGVTHRQMRSELLKSFDKTYILNLHGNAKKKETSPDGTADQNVFDIMAGVSINIFVKKTNKKNGTIFQFDLFGKRDFKYNYLKTNSITSIDWKKLSLLTNLEPWIFHDKSFTKFNTYICVTDLFPVSTPCIRTHKDKELVSFNPFVSEHNQKYLFKAFDNRFVDFDLKKIGRARIKVMKEMINKDNISFIYQRGCSSENPHTPFITKYLSDQGAIRPGTTSTSTMAPLYLYPIQETNDIFTEKDRIPNLNIEIVERIEEILELTFTNEKETTETTFAPIDILDYIYAVLHSPTYREKYKEFLKIDFPRVPYPTDQEKFWQLVELGGQLREIHLLESPKVNEFITSYPIDGDNTVTRKMTTKSIGWEPTNEEKTTGRVWINDTQYFDGVPLVAWEFYIGGYQPAQKWLKDRHGRTLGFEDLRHYQKIIIALTETNRLMKEIDKIEID